MQGNQRQNVFVLGLLDWQRSEVETIEKADEIAIHPLLTLEQLAEEHRGFDELVAMARKQIEESGLKPAAIVCHWDFPSSCIAPVLSKEYGLPGPSLESVLKCEHKYWSRLEQQKVVPDCVPAFEAVDPFDPEAADKLKLDFPLWLKPVKGFSSKLGFMIESREELDNALAEMRAEIGELGDAFDECLEHADLPPEVRNVRGTHALAEGIMSGVQFAPEGYVQNGEIHLHGMFDMLLDDSGTAVLGLRYPAELPRALHERAEDVARRIIRQVGFDNACFNVEFLYDEPNDKLWVIEVNTRISQSHCEMFRLVDGMSNHEIAVSVAMGRTPEFPHHKGNSATSAKFYLTKEGDAEVTRVPTDAEIAALSEEFNALIELPLHKGDRLSKLANQPVYRYNLGAVWIGAHSKRDLTERYYRFIDRLPVEFSDGQGLSA